MIYSVLIQTNKKVISLLVYISFLYLLLDISVKVSILSFYIKDEFGKENKTDKVNYSKLLLEWIESVKLLCEIFRINLLFFKRYQNFLVFFLKLLS